MQCPQCQHDNLAGQKFCGECGARLAATCSTCSAPNPPSQKFCGECGTPLSKAPDPRFTSPQTYTPPYLAERILTSKVSLEGERKQVTVVFADLKGSMELLADRDPEEARKLLDPVLERMMEAVHRYEGTVNQVMGDGIMALFGAPVAHEDHAIRACYAALRMQDSAKKYAEDVWKTAGLRLQIRVGINSGEVVVRSIRSDLRMDYTAVGQTTHLGARMEQMATPGTTLIAADTLRLAEGFVQVRSLGAVPVKGLNRPVEVYELTGTSPVRSRLQAAAARGLTMFVGRDGEMEVLCAALDEAKSGKGQIVAVVGEPGVGKSRLCWEFTRSQRTQGCLLLEAACAPYGKTTTYLPVTDLLKSYFQIEPQDNVRKVREKLTEKVLSLDRALERYVTPLLWLLDMPAEDPEWDRLDAPLRRQRLLEGLRGLLLRESQIQPLVLVFEDLHWIDSESRAFLDSFMESLPAARVLLLVNYRPEYSHDWGGKTYYRQLRVDALPTPSAERLLATLLGEHPSLDSLRSILVNRTDGNPFFIEEGVRALIETGSLTGERGAYRLVSATASTHVPPTVQVVLAARIDRLAAEDKRLLQTASVIGRDVPYGLLLAIVGGSEPELRAGLARLQRGEFLYEIQLFPEPEYTFKHALTQEVTYQTVLADRRRMLHAQVVEAIEHLYSGRLDEQMERLAEHARRGEVWGKAVLYCQQAGGRAAARSAHRQAAALFEAALDCVPHLAQSRETQAISIDLLLAVRALSVPLGQPDRSLGAVQRALALAETLDDSERLTRAVVAAVNARYITGDAAGAVALGDRALTLSAGSGLPAQVEARTYVAQGYIALGAYRRAIDLLEHNRERAPGSNTTINTSTGLRSWPASRPSTSILSDAYLAWGLGEVGRFGEALAVAQEGALLAGTLDSARVYSRLCALFGLSMPAILRGDFQGAIPPLEESIACARESRMFGWLAPSTGLLGYAYGRSGRLQAGLRLLEEAIRQAAATTPPHKGFYLSCYSELLLLDGHTEGARTAATSGLEGARTRGESGDAARCLLALGEAEMGLVPADADAARRHLQEALTLATDLDALPLIAHSHLRLGKLLQGTGERADSVEHLTTAATMYRDMGMAYWLDQAEVELKTLA